MTLAEAILEIERQFIVHHEVGQPASYYDQDKKPIASAVTGARDMSRAPCGVRYITVTSGGTDDIFSVLFHDEVRAVRWWRWAVEDYAESIAPPEKFSKLHLYWRDKPVFEKAVYLPLDQAGLLQNAIELPLMAELGTVRSKLLISKLRPDGSEEPDV